MGKVLITERDGATKLQMSVVEKPPVMNLMSECMSVRSLGFLQVTRANIQTRTSHSYAITRWFSLWALSLLCANVTSRGGLHQIFVALYLQDGRVVADYLLLTLK